MKRERLFKCRVMRFSYLEAAQYQAERRGVCMQRLGTYPRSWTRRMLLLCRYAVEEVWLLKAAGQNYLWVVPHKCDCDGSRMGLPDRAQANIFCPMAIPHTVDAI